MYVSIDDPHWLHLYKRFKARALYAVENEISVIDPIIRNTIRAMNKRYEVATTFCCQGHPFEQTGKEQPGPDKGYIAIVTQCDQTQGGLLRELNNINARLWVDHGFRHMFDIEVSLTTGDTVIDMSPDELYSSIVIRTPSFNNKRVRNRWWDRFHKALLETTIAK